MIEKEEDVVSNCCGAPVYAETDVCMDCKEHCEVIGELAWLDENWEPKEVTYNGKEVR